MTRSLIDVERHVEDVIEDFDWLVGGGVSPEHAASRVGVALSTISTYRSRSKAAS
ncbi:hypothetical protein nbrc107696_45990 [Gordonia spumicola]|uniref:Transposase n=1 Tax=Gordonia spumicola TaxID=589161 RepID=A0A7I9V4X4_9ACTN|nr:hypothetical protein [Gordonia spumicola]GEE00224.1 hypothetical protein nbrc107696_06700 [Gordonia spumicola]GEE04153.1 hypothetical protein nbrc107696_45990 [Gordonia spumicola]